jgi:signal transduction histidine kinase
MAQPVDLIKVSVADQGPGLSPDRCNEVFELFSRRDGDTVLDSV